MRKVYLTLVLIVSGAVLMSFYTTRTRTGAGHISNEDSLRQLYSRPVSEWPRPFIDSGVNWQELAPIPKDTVSWRVDQNPVTKLGKRLFFDPRLSGSNQISCSSCHDPDLAWADGRVVSLGNDHLQGRRNTQSLLNVDIWPKLFWDGRANDFETQMVEPLSAHHEMNMVVPTLAKKLGKIKGYQRLFDSAFGKGPISFKKIAASLGAFQRTIKSRSTKFDEFMQGKYEKLSNEEIAGLHLFRTNARCMNCHNGSYFTDKQFHNIGLTYYKREYEDLGRYNVTKDPADIGRFRTPSLRELINTRPWMHNGLFNNLDGVVNMYNSGMQMPPRTEEQKNDPLFPKTDRLLKKLNLTKEEKRQLVAFLNTLNGVPFRMQRPVLPQ